MFNSPRPTSRSRRKVTRKHKKTLTQVWLKSGRKQPAWILVLMLVLASAAYLVERQIRETHAYAGLPQAHQAWQAETWHRVLRNPGFMVGYSDLRMNPLWVTYRLDAGTPGPIGRRPPTFSADWRTLIRIDHHDYTGSGYDRGHLAPNYAMARVHGREAQLKSFLMTNISPQTPELNRQVWQRIEAAAMDHFVPIKGELWVITGPVFSGFLFGSEVERLSSSWVEIPDAFYKIFIAPATAERPLKVLAFLVPQNVRGNEPLGQFLVSVREIEDKTGLNFLHRLPQDLQDRVETQVLPAPWQLDKVSRQPGRYAQ
ncbi:DNA/RNA non-specific endonuclease [Nitrincola tapanii]|uniref:DNA/RNA non-specific endonuclease n=1 Tax=Nitrincola tapanii TaxID=1708751 RepID=A0A5A9VYM4_9GAMM|nr:DNA/RNA non-specific endonuclease [Nitrincola tapanii]KAA0873576.1 DNA/RNA non-specific endonuclease [Nitrincola tapanii]